MADIALIGSATKLSASDATITLPSVSYLSGDLLVLAVMHRSALTTPTGWTLQQTIGPAASDSNNQQTSLLTQTTSTAGAVAQVVAQASSGRLGAAILVVRNATGVSARSDLAQVYDTSATSYATAAKGAGLIVWAISAPIWATTDPAATTPSAISVAAAPSPTWPDASTSNQPRLGVFFDYDADTDARTFTGAGVNSQATLAAIQLLGDVPVVHYLPAPRYAEMGPHRSPNVIGKGTPAAPPKTTGQIWPRGKR